MRPSWHLQCAAMARKYLGDGYDIHTSGRGTDLSAPREHHRHRRGPERQAAGPVSGCTATRCSAKASRSKRPTAARPWRRFWPGAFSGREVRFWLLGTHYRKPIVFSAKRLEDTRRALKRLDTFIANLRALPAAAVTHPDLDQRVYDIKSGFADAMDDDLNISGALAAIFRAIRPINALMQRGGLDHTGAQRLIETFRGIDKVLNIFDFQEALEDPPGGRLLCSGARRPGRRATGPWPTGCGRKLQCRGVAVRDGRLPDAG